MILRFFAITSSALLLACGSGSDEPQGVTAPAGEATQVVPVSGTYEVSGTTTERDTGSQRGVSGTVILHAEGDTYTSTFNLATTLVASGEPQKAELIGRGDGVVEGRKLTGTAETQMIIALVPGVDAGFSFMPRHVTARMTNDAVATIDEKGSVVIEIESNPAEGDTSYKPTRTVLRGKRISPIGIGGAAK